MIDTSFNVTNCALKSLLDTLLHLAICQTKQTTRNSPSSSPSKSCRTLVLSRIFDVTFKHEGVPTVVVEEKGIANV